MTRSKKDADLLKELGYDPDDPSYVVENFGDDEVTVTETGTTVADEFDKFSDEELLQAVNLMRKQIDEATDLMEAIIKYIVNKPKP